MLHELRTISGFEGALVLCRRTTGKQLDIEVLTFWRSMNAIRRFAGPNMERAVVEDDAKAVLLTFAKSAQHFEVLLDARTRRGQARNPVRLSN